MIRLILVVLGCCVLALAGCKEEADTPSVPQGSDQSYFPIAVGNEWTWVGGLGGAAEDTIRWKVTRTVIRDDGKPAWNVQYERQWAGKEAVIDSSNLRIEGDLLLLFQNIYDPDADTVLSYPLAVGKEWYIAHVLRRRLHRRAVIAAKEDVETPFGVFKDALRIDTVDRTEDTDSLLQKASEWYAPNVGRVMARIEARGEVFEMKLLSAKLN